MAAMADVLITEYTDPACPWAYSAEPFRQRLNWLYGDRLEWQVRMVVLSESVAELEERGFGVEQLSAAYRAIARDHGMPIDTSERPRMAASRPACEAVVAARLHAPERTRALLRALRVRNFAGELLDAPETLAGAAADAGLDHVALGSWMTGDDVRAALEEDKALARAPMPAARVLDHKLANWSGGMRYTCPSYEIVRKSDGVRIAVPRLSALRRLRHDPRQPGAGPRPARAALRRRGGARVGGRPAGLQGGRGRGGDGGLGGARGARPGRDRAPRRRGRLLEPL
jgi:predicted DsbA family dithiol-disulfide isomerase